MTEDTADRYRRLAAAFAAIVAAVPADAWSRPSPCEGWSARDVLDHVVATQGMILRMVGSDLEPVPAEPLAAWQAAAAQTQARLDDPVLADAEFDGMFGRTTYAAAVDRFLCNDLVVHQWDLATATGQSLAMRVEDLARLRTAVAEFGDAARAPGVYGPELEVADDADEQTKVLALVGRRA